MNDLQEQLGWLPQPFAITRCTGDGRFLKLAYAHGNATSPDPSTKNGAVLVDRDGRIISYATNRFARGVEATKARLDDRPTKYRMVVHAENGAVFNAARCGKSTKDATLYCPFYSCSECAKAIIQSGIRRVVGHAQIMVVAAEHKAWTESICHGWEMMHEAGVECILFDGIVGVLARLNFKDIAV
jgi:dCMP deaminase